MRTVTFGVASIGTVSDRVRAAFHGAVTQTDRIDFADAALLWTTLTPQRWDLLQAMSGDAPLSAAEAARRVGRDVEAVSADIEHLVTSGIIDEARDQGYVFPYDAIHVDFTLVKAA